MQKNNILPDTKELLVKLAEQYIDYDYPHISATDYMKFSRTGNRVDFEDKYFDKRYALNSLILAECANKDSHVYLDSIINGIFSICEESGWQLPPHNSYPDSNGNMSLPDTSRPVLDLFSCETGALLSFAGYLLRDKLDFESPFIHKRIDNEVISRVLNPYINTFVWWMGTEPKGMCNWTPWCTQNVLIAATYTDIPYEDKSLIFKKAYKSIEMFINSYGDDGCCDEGALYYRHAGLCLYLGIAMLEEDSSPLDTSLYPHLSKKYSAKLKNIAEYICNVHVSGEYYINYSDCAPNPGACGIREFLYGQLVGSKPLMNLAYEDFTNIHHAYSDSQYLMPNEINLYYRYLAVTKEKEIRNYSPDNLILPSDVWYSSVGLGIIRNSSRVLAIKAGCNGDSHNHNDTGSITLYIDNKPVLIDIGVESYTAKTFSNDRYSIWTMQSCFHNIPTIDGYDELPGAMYKADDVSIELVDSSDKSVILDNDSVGSLSSHDYDCVKVSMNIANAYFDAESNKKRISYIRSVSFDKHSSQIVLKDVLEDTNEKDLHNNYLSKDSLCRENSGTDSLNNVIQNYITCEKPEYIPEADNKGTLCIGANHKFMVEGVSKCDIETYPITDRRLGAAWNTVYRIRLTQNTNSFKLII